MIKLHDYVEIIGLILTVLGAILAVIEKKRVQKKIAGIIIALAGIAIFLIVYSKNVEKIDSTIETIKSVEYADIKANSGADVNIENNKADETENNKAGETENNNTDEIGSDNTDMAVTEPEDNNTSEINESDDIEKPEPASISLSDVVWLEEENIHKDISATTMRGEQWSDCIGFGSSNINSDGTAVILAVCDQKYRKFTAEIAPQEDFDKSEEVTLYIYGVCNDEQTFREEYQINRFTKPFEVEIDISGIEDLYFWKAGEYNQGRIAGQFINDYSGMGVLMREATLYR